MDCMDIIGLDLSVTGTGVCGVRSDGEYITANFGSKPDYGHHMKRIGFIVDSIRPYFALDTVCFIEDYAYGKSPGSSSLAMLAELGGIVKYFVWKRTGAYPFLINQSTIKKWLGAGNMKKGEMPNATFHKYGIQLKTHDECVALAIADIGCHLLGRKDFVHSKLGTKEMEVMKGLHKKYDAKIRLTEQKINRVQ